MASSMASSVARSICAAVDGAVQGVLAPAALVERVRPAFDAVHAGRQRFFDALPGGHFSFVGTAADSFIRMRVQVDQGRHGQRLDLAVQLEIPR